MTPQKQVILSGIQPTNLLTLGNYLGALKNWVKIQGDYQSYFMAVDLHAITVRQDPEKLRSSTLSSVAFYLAAGIDPTTSAIFIQSHVPAHTELAWLLNCVGYMGEVSRMTQFKDKGTKAGANVSVGLFTYPLLMAADILLYDTTYVPVGDDQKQHVELTRDVGQRLNAQFGDDTVAIPEPFIVKVSARILDLQNPEAKMSKSSVPDTGTIFISDSAAAIEAKFKRAVTDSGSDIIFDPENKPGVSNMLSIQAAITQEPIDAVVERYRGKQYGHLKMETAAIVRDELRPLYQRANELVQDETELLRILKIGSEKASAHAERTLKRIKSKFGFVLND